MQPISDNAFQGILLSLTPRLRAFARMLSSMPQFADDLVHNTLLQAWEQRYSAPRREQIDEWLFYLLRNYYYMDIRRQAVIRMGGNRVMTPIGQIALRAGAVNALAELSDLEREVIILFDASGFECEQIARIVSAPERSVKIRLSNARQQLLELDKRSKSKSAKSAAVSADGASRLHLH